MLQSCQRCNGFFHFSSSKTAPAFCTEAGAVFLHWRKPLPGRPTPRRFWRDTRRKDARFRLPPPKRGFPLCGGGRANRGQRRQERTWKQQLVPPKAARSFAPLKQTPYAGRTGRMGRKGAPRAKKENNRAAESPKGDLPCPGSAATARRSGKSPPAAAAMERGAALHLPPHRPGF